MKPSLLVLIFCILISCQTSEKQAAAHHPSLATTIDSILNTHNFSGVVLVAKDSVDLYSMTVGLSDLENKTKLHFNSQFVIGSISKQITAVLVLQEFEKGRLGLQDTIASYLAGIDQPWINAITVHQLLTHTHGIVALNEPLEFQPGTQFHYSQLGYELLAQILEEVSGKTFQELSSDMFHEYGLAHTFHPDNSANKALACGYEESDLGKLAFAENSLENYAAAGSFISTASDLARWNMLLHSNKLLQAETVELMRTNYATRVHPIFDSVQYGYGLLFKAGEQDVEIGTLGYAPGFVSALYYYPKSNLILVVLGNTARNLDDFKKMFIVHTEIMDAVKSVR